MFAFLRKLIVPIIVTVLVFFVAMIVLEWGLEFSTANQFGQAESAAVINGEKVSWAAYNQLYSNLYQQASKTDTLGLSEQQERELQQRAWNSLLHDRLLLQQAERHGIEVTNEEIYEYLKRNPPQELRTVEQFLTNGQFDGQKYFSAMTNPEFAPFWASMEPYLRSELKKMKMQELILQGVQISEAEVMQEFLGRNEQVKVGAVYVTYDRFTRPPPTLSDDEIKAYYEANKDDYKLNERAALNIVLVEKKASDRDWDIAFSRLKSIRDSVNQGIAFEDLAARHSQDVTRTDGGNLGWFARGTMVPEFDRFAFSMREGEVSEPFRTQFGWHIIKHNGYKEEMETPPGKTAKELVKRANCSHILLKVEPSKETIDGAYSKLTELAASAKSSNFEQAAKDAGLEVKKTEPFERGNNIQYIGSNPEAGMFAFDQPKGSVSPVYENNSSVFIVQALEKLPAGEAPYESVREKVQLDALRDRVAQMARDTATAIHAKILSGMPIDQAAKMHGSTYEELDPFARLTTLQRFGRDPKAVGAAFSLENPGDVSKPADFAQGTVIFKLIERISPELGAFNQERDSIYQVVLSSRQQTAYAKWVESLIADSKIENNIERALSVN